MRKTTCRGRAGTRWLTEALILLLVVAGVAACAGDRPGETTTAAASTEPASTSTSTLPASTTQPASTTLPPVTLATTTTVPLPTPPLAFDTDLAMEHIRALASDVGVRPSGSSAEDAAVDYAAHYLTALGYAVTVTEVPLPNGKTSHNVQAVKQGSSPWTLAIGGHLDSKVTTPGANDDASGVAVVLELARDLHDADITPTVEFVLFGAEEIIDSNRSHHHFGSRRYVADMTERQRAALAGMISVDMVGYGQKLTIRNMDRGPQSLTEMLLSRSADAGIPSAYSKDTGPTGFSDHEAFEAAGYPVAWLEWQDDPTYHKAGDTYKHCDPEVVRRSGEMLLGFLADLGETQLASLADARNLH